jgi:hypothetical protein
MWIKTKDKLVNTRHLAEIKINSVKMQNNSVVHELTACAARKEHQNTVLVSDLDKNVILKYMNDLEKALENNSRTFNC